MNRQVVPSMVLSVLIVCFFAVVLFPLERDREQAAKEGVAPKAAEPLVAPATAAQSPPPVSPSPSPAPPVVVRAAPAPLVVAPEPKGPDAALKDAAAESKAPGPPPRPEPLPSPAVAEPAVVAKPPEEDPGPAPIEALADPTPIEAAAERPESAPAPEILGPPPRPDFAPVAASTPVPVMPVRVPFPPASEEVVARAGPAEGVDDAPAAVATGVKEIVPEPGRPDAPTIRSEPVSIPRGDPEATVVEPGETLEDVSVRVYGTKAGVGTLLGANREVLTRRKGPLRAGLQLWTPPRW